MESDRYLLSAPCDIIGRCVEYLLPEDLMEFELVSKTTKSFIAERRVWKNVFQLLEEVPPSEEPPNWKRYLLQCRRERQVYCKIPISDTHAVIYWRVQIPEAGAAPPDEEEEELTTVKSREFAFSKDALGGEINWQCCLTIDDGNNDDRESNRTATLRLWTTGIWTPETVKHYFGSYCTACIRNSLNTRNLQCEQYFDVDSNAGFTITVPRSSSEIVVQVNLTLLLSQHRDSLPLFNAFSDDNYSEVTKIGLAQALSELALYKRKELSGLLKQSEIEGIHQVAEHIKSGLETNREGSISLCAELFQVVSNMFGPAVICDVGVKETINLIVDICQKEIAHLLSSPCVNENQRLAHGMMLSLNAVVGLSEQFLESFVCYSFLSSLLQLATTPGYSHIQYPCIVTVLSATVKLEYFPAPVMNTLTLLMASFMEHSDPTNPNTCGMVWDEYDIGGYFVPLLTSGNVLSVSFASWCISKYYFY